MLPLNLSLQQTVPVPFLGDGDLNGCFMLPDDQAALIVDQTVHLVNLRNGITKSVKMEHQLQILFIHREHLIGYVNPETNTLKFFNTVTMALEAMEVKLSGQQGFQSDMQIVSHFDVIYILEPDPSQNQMSHLSIIDKQLQYKKRLFTLAESTIYMLMIPLQNMNFIVLIKQQQKRDLCFHIFDGNQCRVQEITVPGVTDRLLVVDVVGWKDHQGKHIIILGNLMYQSLLLDFDMQTGTISIISQFDGLLTNCVFANVEQSLIWLVQLPRQKKTLCDIAMKGEALKCYTYKAKHIKLINKLKSSAFMQLGWFVSKDMTIIQLPLSSYPQKQSFHQMEQEIQPISLKVFLQPKSQELALHYMIHCDLMNTYGETLINDVMELLADEN